MVSHDAHEVLKQLDEAISVINESKSVEEFFRGERPAFQILATIGDLFLQLTHPNPEQKHNPEYGERLKKLEEALIEVEKELMTQFHYTQMTVTDSKFTSDVITKASSLMRSTLNCLKHQNHDSLVCFREIYKRYTPLKTTYIMMTLLEHKSTNPLIMALAAEKDQKAFTKWDEIVSELLAQLMFIEGIASGMLKEKKSFDFDRIKDRWEDFENVTRKWWDEFGSDSYWEEMKDFLKDFIPNNRDLNNNQKAMKIVTKLDAYNSKEAFYIVVCDTPSNSDYVLLKNFVDEDQFIIVKDNTTSIYVYRSFYGMSASFEDVEKLKTGTEWYQQYPHRGDPGMPSGLMNHQLANSGFNMLIGSVNEEIYWVNCPQFECGPGWTTKKCDYGASIDQIYIVGFR